MGIVEVVRETAALQLSRLANACSPVRVYRLIACVSAYVRACPRVVRGRGKRRGKGSACTNSAQLARSFAFRADTLRGLCKSPAPGRPCAHPMSPPGQKRPARDDSRPEGDRPA